MQRTQSWWQDWWRIAAQFSASWGETKEEKKPEPTAEEESKKALFYIQDDESDDGDDVEESGKQVVVGVCAMAKKSLSKPMSEILARLEEFEYIKIVVFPEEVILKEPVDKWPLCDCLISFHSKGFPLDKANEYAILRDPYIINNIQMQYDIQDRRKVYAILEKEGIQIPRYAVLDRDSSQPSELIESEDHVEVDGVIFNKPFVEKPVSAEDHNIYIYYPTSAGGGSQRLFRKIGSRSSVYSPESRVRKTGSFIYEDFMPTDGTDVKVYTVGPDYAHAEARKSPALDGKVERDSEGKEIRYPVILSNEEKLISRKVCDAFKQTVCGFDLLRANGQSFVCDVNGFSFVKNSNKYYDDSAKILGNMVLRQLAPTLDIPWSVPFQLDDPPIVPTTFGKMMELRCVVAVIRHGDRTPKQKMKVEVRHPKFFEVFEKYDGYKKGHVKLKRPTQLQEILDIARFLLNEIQHSTADPEIEEKQGKLEQLKSVLEMYGHFSGINRKVQMKYQPRGRPRGSSSDDDLPKEPSLVLILKWGGELTPAGRIQAEELGKIFRCMYPGGQGRHINNGEYAGTQGLGLLRLHSTFRHDLKIYASDEGRVQMTAAAFAKGLLALEGELTPILVQMVKSANTNGLLDNDCDCSKYQNIVKARLHEIMQQDKDFTQADREIINPCDSISIATAMDFVKNPVKCCEKVQELIQKLMAIVKMKKDDVKCKDAILYHGETWELMHRRWSKIDKDFCTKNKTFDISKIPDIYDCIKYDLQHNQHTLQFEFAEELYTYAKYLADVVIPQEYGLSLQEKLAIGQGICTPLFKKIRADLLRNIEESGDSLNGESVNRLNPRYSYGVSSPGRHVRTRLYFTSESHVHSLLTMLRFGDLINSAYDEQWKRAMDYISAVSELNYMSQIVIMLYEDPTKDPSSEERFHVELHFSPGVNCCVQKNLPPGPGFRPHSRNESNATSLSPSCDQSVEDLSELLPSKKEKKLGKENVKFGEEAREGIIISSIPMGSLQKPSVAEEPENFFLKASDDFFNDQDRVVFKNTSTPLNSDDEISPPAIPKDVTIKCSFTPKSDENGKRSTSPVPISNKGIQSRSAFEDLARDLTARLNQCIQDGEPRSRSFDHPKEFISYQKSNVHRPKHQSLEAVNREVFWSLPTGSVGHGDVDADPTISCGDFANERDVQLLRSSSPIKIPRTVPLYLESTNDILPDSPSLKYLQISPETNVGSVNFPEVTFSNLVAVKKKNHCKGTGKVRVELRNEDFPVSLANKRYSSIPSNFVYSDGAFSDRYRKVSEVSVRESDESRTGPRTPHNNATIVESPEQDSTFQVTRIIVSPCQPVIDQTALFDDPAKLIKPTNLPKPPPVPPTTSSPNSSACIPAEKPESKPSAPVLPADGPSRHHRHSVAGNHNLRQNWAYFQLYGISVGPSGGVFFNANKNKLLGSTNSLFSTAVISGSCSAPNLRDALATNQSISAIEGWGGVPPIRPLETLHNALSLKHLDGFLQKMTSVPLYRTPASTPPHPPSTPLPYYGSTWSGASSLVSEASSPKMSRSMSVESSYGLDERALLKEKTASWQSSQKPESSLETVGFFMECDDHMDELAEQMTLDTDDTLQEMKGGLLVHNVIGQARERTDSGELTPVSIASEFDYSVGMGSLTKLTKEMESENEGEKAETEDDYEFEADDAERTITKAVEAARESIVGFFDSKVQSNGKFSKSNAQ